MEANIANYLAECFMPSDLQQRWLVAGLLVRIHLSTSTVAALARLRTFFYQHAHTQTERERERERERVNFDSNIFMGRLRGLAVACWTTDHTYPFSNPGISEGCFIFDFASLPLDVARPI